MVCGKNPPPLLTRALVFRSPLVLLVGLFQEISAASQYTCARRGREYAQSRGVGCALDEVGLAISSWQPHVYLINLEVHIVDCLYCATFSPISFVSTLK